MVHHVLGLEHTNQLTLCVPGCVSCGAVCCSGKHLPTYTPSMDMGAYVVVINADKVVVSGKKPGVKTYFRHVTGRPGSWTIETFNELQKVPQDSAVHLWQHPPPSFQRCFEASELSSARRAATDPGQQIADRCSGARLTPSAQHITCMLMSASPLLLCTAASA